MIKLTMVSANNDAARVDPAEIAFYCTVSGSVAPFTQMTLKGSGTTLDVQESVEAIDTMLAPLAASVDRIS
jgi:hypothetical protein